MTDTTLPLGQANRRIGNCQGWLMSQVVLPSWTHYGVKTVPTGRTEYEDIWFRAFDVYQGTSDGYFEWWDALTVAAFDLYGWSPPFFAAGNAADAIGMWTGFTPLWETPNPDDRHAAASVPFATYSPCVFYRPSWSTEQILFQCKHPNYWGQAQPFNDIGIDPAASEPSATIREESGTTYIYVHWRGTDNRIHYRRFDASTMSIGPPLDLGSAHLTSGSVVTAAVDSGGATERLLVVYHPLAASTWFYWTYHGAGSFFQDLGLYYDSNVDATLATYPYRGRIYFIRPDASWSGTPNVIRYASYTPAAGFDPAPWAGSLHDLSGLYTDPDILPEAVFTDRSISAVAYSRSPADPRLRLTYATPPLPGVGRELWYMTLIEWPSTPGTLDPHVYRAVPLATINSLTSQSAGGLAPHPWGWPLYHFWGSGVVPGSPEMQEWRTHSD